MQNLTHKKIGEMLRDYNIAPLSAETLVYQILKPMEYNKARQLLYRFCLNREDRTITVKEVIFFFEYGF